MSKSDKKAEANRKTAMEAATSYLANRMHTTEEMRKHLRDKGYSDSEIDETVNDLIGLRYLDDYMYALRYYELNHEKRRGGKRAKRELEEKGVDRETIKNAYEDFAYENKVDEYAMALEIARAEVFVETDMFGSEDREVRVEMREVDDRLVAKVARKLETRGFTNDVIFRVMSEMRRWNPDDKGYN